MIRKKTFNVLTALLLTVSSCLSVAGDSLLDVSGNDSQNIDNIKLNLCKFLGSLSFFERKNTNATGSDPGSTPLAKSTTVLGQCFYMQRNQILDIQDLAQFQHDTSLFLFGEFNFNMPGKKITSSVLKPVQTSKLDFSTHLTMTVDNSWKPCSAIDSIALDLVNHSGYGRGDSLVTDRLNHPNLFNSNSPERTLKFDARPSVLPDKEFLSLGFKDYITNTKQFKLGALNIHLEKLGIYGSMLYSRGKVNIGDFIEASGNLYLDMSARNLRADSRITIYKIPLAGRIRLLSRTYIFSSPRPDIFEPGLGRGFKFNLSDFALSDARILSHAEIQIPPFLGGSGIVSSLMFNRINGLQLRLFVDMPNISIPGIPIKLGLPNFNFVVSR